MYVRAIAYVLPSWRVDNATIADWSGLDPSFVAEKIGIRSRAFLTHEETGVGLAKQACERLFGEYPDLDPMRVKLVTFVTQNPDYKLPHNSALLQTALGLGEDTACFDLNLGCSGYVYALSINKGLMAGEGIDDALLVTCDPYSKIMDRKNRDVIGLFGDAATVTWLSAEQGGTIGRADLGTDGSGAHHLIVRRGGAAYPDANLDGAVEEKSTTADRHLHMGGRAIFNFMMTRVPTSLERCLEKNGIDKDAIDYFVFHQASGFLLNTLIDHMALPKEKVPIALDMTGNTVSSTIPMVLGDLMSRGAASGKTILISGFGVGLSWATNIITFGE